ncbi:MAG: FecR family protein [Planctomycetota bacterium]|nr:FecR family protein [Planctomycetota bacterium]
MNEPKKLEQLWGDFLEGEWTDASLRELKELLDDAESEKKAVDLYQLHRLLGLLLNSGKSESDCFVAETMQALPVNQDQFVSSVENLVGGYEKEKKEKHRVFPNSRAPFWGLAATIAVSLMFALGWFLLSSDAQRKSIEIVELRGRMILSADQGEVIEQPTVGEVFRGGTLESLSPDAYCLLRFHDHTTVALSGRTLLTVSQKGPKRLRLHHGKISAQVTSQPVDKPMLVMTEAAEMTVLGTEFNVEEKPGSTSLVVNEGKVRVKRLGDGVPVDVPAQQSVIVSLENQNGLEPEMRAEPVTQWKSDLQSDTLHGKWVSDLAMKALKLKKSVSQGEISVEDARVAYKKAARLGDLSGSIWSQPTSIGSLVVLSPRLSARHPLKLTDQSVIRIRGKKHTPSPLVFGLSVAHPGGGFAGKYRSKPWGQELAIGEEFEKILPVHSFHDEKSPGKPATGFELTDWWCLSRDSAAKFEISSVELLDHSIGLHNSNADSTSINQLVLVPLP